MTTRQLALALEPRPALGREDFLVADANRDAVAWLDRWPQWPAPALSIVGPSGCGKTHLAQVWRASVEAAGAGPVLELDVPDMIRESAFDLLGANRCCLLDDADRNVAGNAAAERALFHLYNHLAGRRGHLLLTAQVAPARWPIALADLRSRLVSAPSVALKPANDELLGAILLKLFADRQLAVGKDVILYLLGRMDRSFAGARAMVAELDRAALAGRRRVTVPLARAVLAANDLER